MDNAGEAIAATGLLVAAMRAEESAREDALFTDPFAERLAGEAGRRLLAEATSDTAQSSGQIVIRTRFWDEALLRARADGAAQVVILAAGMDARAYRLPWPAGTTVYEVDQPQVIATKDELLAGEQPRCRRVAVGVDLADDWPKTLLSHGFSPTSRSVWLIEGLLQYLQASDVDALFARIDTLSAPGSQLLYDIVGATLMEAPFLQPTLEFMRQLGAPWTFSTDAPAALVEERGWTATVTDVAEPGTRWNRWEHPVVPLEVPGVPRGYFVEAAKT
ncbi:SAM-dependent methyltransferase [Mycobacterium heidelbergense]|uniref:S-adenosyl-L-methionine-dependent methyltransferase n=1 Tax=Mycobacterium heidelbergense TaxID=53376 RepID=A0A1X0D953_MYCHE|nr:SAM-dependent methyltransferase [Mycobacterium heidelbergense]MCV7049491.1 SAM-dependent methyltransferase [Mycobacterium heidelbergense]ORA68934.1 SAM-dependent methyltransferase [Mycobacterium heidelbergense]BBZ52612.1 S-adenosyl-L-methionine-dependent methyltransferase [Mycobacterium heidelbergense]